MLSIIYVNYKTSKDILNSLASIVKYEKNYKSYEFIIVDNDSGDSGIEIIRKNYPFVKIIQAPKNGGFAYGNNIGINNSNGDMLLLLNPDTYLTNNGIELLLSRIQNDSSIDIIGPQLLNVDGTNQSAIAPKSYLTLWQLLCDQLFLNRLFKKSKIFNSYLKTYLDPEKESFVTCVSGAAFMFRRNIIDKIGLLDELFFIYFEETDYCLRADKHGLKMLYYPGSKITHLYGSSNTPGSERSISYYVDSFKRYFKKHNNNLIYIASLSILTSGSLLRLIFLKLLSRPKYITYYYYLKNIFSRGLLND